MLGEHEAIQVSGRSVGRRRECYPMPSLAAFILKILATCDISQYRQKAFANCIWRGLRHSGEKSSGLPTRIHNARAREVATLSRFGLYKNSIPRGASSGEEVVSE